MQFSYAFYFEILSRTWEQNHVGMENAGQFEIEVIEESKAARAALINIPGLSWGLSICRGQFSSALEL